MHAPHSSLLALCLPLALSSWACEAPATAVLVNVKALDGVNEARLLTAAFVDSRARRSTQLTPRGGGLIFSETGDRTTRFVVRTNTVGAAQIFVSALGPCPTGNDCAINSRPTIGEGNARLIVVKDQLTRVDITLIPSDYTVNTSYAGDQFFGTGSVGRQTASDENGNFVVVWQDSCSAKKCGVLARLFNRRGAPRLISGSKKQFAATDPAHGYNMPAVAMRSDGRFVIVAKRLVLASSGAIYSRAFGADGQPYSANATEQRLDQGGLIDVNSPDIARLVHREPTRENYAVVWAQRRRVSGKEKTEVVGRILDADGRAVTVFNVASFDAKSDSGATCASDLACPSGEHCARGACRQIPAAPSVAAGPAPGVFIVTWQEGGNVRAQAFQPPGQKLGAPLFVAKTPTGRAMSADSTGLQYGYAVTWSDRVNSGPDKDGRCIRLRRLTLNGKAIADDYTLNTTAGGDQQDPAIAAAPKDAKDLPARSAMLVLWQSASTDDPQGGLRGRRLLSIGAPVGDDFRINTTTIGVQKRPSIAPRGRDGFVAVFVDGSGAPLDTALSGIRARLLYPKFDGGGEALGGTCQLGGACANANLFCASLGLGIGNRCVSTCAGAGQPCANGGDCRQVSGGNNFICSYVTE